MIPGEIITKNGTIILNEGKKTIRAEEFSPALLPSVSGHRIEIGEVPNSQVRNPNTGQDPTGTIYRNCCIVYCMCSYA